MGFAIKDLDLSPRSVTHLSCSKRQVSGPRVAHLGLSLSSLSHLGKLKKSTTTKSEEIPAAHHIVLRPQALFLNPNVTFFISELARTMIKVPYRCHYHVRFGIRIGVAATSDTCR